MKTQKFKVILVSALSVALVIITLGVASALKADKNVLSLNSSADKFEVHQGYGDMLINEAVTDTSAGAMKCGEGKCGNGANEKKCDKKEKCTKKKMECDSTTTKGTKKECSKCGEGKCGDGAKK